MASTAVKRLMTEYRGTRFFMLELMSNPPDGITAGPTSENDFFNWEAMIIGPESTPYEGGLFQATLKFPKDYPLSPPTMQFLKGMYHPNVYADGRVCISILHPPGDDPHSYEQSNERWSPVQSIEKILLSVVSMLAEPNTESPANIEASKMFRENKKKYDMIVQAGVKETLEL